MVRRWGSKRALLRECGFLNSRFTANAVKPAGAALTSDAAQVAGLGRILFLDFFGHGFSRIRTDQADPVDHVDAHTYT